ncbi:GPR1/FUN34/yaaH family protein [Paraburkholderia sp. BL23I1N1]|nr:GPR1/FUN34/yaaH family protein [Paraburkholderia sp. BL23I1N1]
MRGACLKDSRAIDLYFFLHEEFIMNIKAPNPAALGLAGFALTTWLLSMINAGWFSGTAMGMVLAVAFAYGGTAQMLGVRAADRI